MFEGGRLTGFNNRPETGFEDVKTVLCLARQRVGARLDQGGKIMHFRGDSFTLGVFPFFFPEFVVTARRAHRASGWAMTVNGYDLTR